MPKTVDAPLNCEEHERRRAMQLSNEDRAPTPAEIAGSLRNWAETMDSWQLTAERLGGRVELGPLTFSAWHERLTTIAEMVAALLPPGTVPIPEAEIARLRVIESAAREYAESRREWEETITTNGDLDAAVWRDVCARQDAARANLLALFDPSLPAQTASAKKGERVIVNTLGLTSEQSRLAVEYIGAVEDEATAYGAFVQAWHRYRQADAAASQAQARRARTEAAFKTAVPDWAGRVAER